MSSTLDQTVLSLDVFCSASSWSHKLPAALSGEGEFSLDIGLLKFGPTFTEKFVNATQLFTRLNSEPVLDLLQTLLMGLSSAGDGCSSSCFLLLVSAWTVGRCFCDGLLGLSTKGAVAPSVPGFPPTVGQGGPVCSLEKNCPPRLERGIVTGPIRLDHILGLKVWHICPSSWPGFFSAVGVDVGSSQTPSLKHVWHPWGEPLAELTLRYQ